MTIDLLLGSVLQVLQVGLLLLALLLALPVCVLALQVMLAARLVPANRQGAPTATHGGEAADQGTRPTLAVLMPAHNEALGISASLRTILAQLGPRDQILVVADNCSDMTAEQARLAGAEVIERHDAGRRGKGYALDHGMQHLARQSCRPNVVVIVDADCVVWPGTLSLLARQVQLSGRPVQALDLMQAPDGAGLKTRVAEFAWLVRNQIRPAGWHRLGLPCQLMGTGMAFPWAVLSQAQLATGSLTEDMLLGLQLAEQGWPPQFCPQALVTSEFPVTAKAQAAQRTRWEHGHLALLLTQGPALLVRAVRQRNLTMAALALDLLVPPLVSLALLLIIGSVLGVVLTALAWISHAAGSTTVGVGAHGLDAASLAFPALLGLFITTVLIGWARHGRHILTGRDWLSLPAYVLAKLPMYGRFLGGRREQQWVRTERHDRPPQP